MPTSTSMPEFEPVRASSVSRTISSPNTVGAG
jgi:hypothetical protein